LSIAAPLIAVSMGFASMLEGGIAVPDVIPLETISSFAFQQTVKTDAARNPLTTSVVAQLLAFGSKGI
jgi:hypothetical protein